MDAFLDLSMDREEGPNGPAFLGPVRIKAWMDLTGTKLLPPEVEIIRQMDSAWVAAVTGEMAVSVKVSSGQ